MSTLQRAFRKKVIAIPQKPRSRRSSRAEQRRHVPMRPPSEISPEVAEFCEREGLKKELELFIDLARQFYRPIQRIHTRILTDVDADRDIVIIDVEVDTDQEKLLAMQDQFVSQCVKQIPFEVRERICVLALFPG